MYLSSRGSADSDCIHQPTLTASFVLGYLQLASSQPVPVNTHMSCHILPTRWVENTVGRVWVW